MERPVGAETQTSGLGRPSAASGMPAGCIDTAAQFVVKITKHCNLRCAYCYEFPHLGDKTQMSLESLARIFDNIASSADDVFDTVNFVWHGGEPFLIPLEYYDAIGALQRQIFGTAIRVSNVVQTNLTVLTPKHLQHLRKQKFFSGLGVSFDVYGNQRIDTADRPRTEIVLANIQKLIDCEIPFGAIVVLARNTLPHVRSIFRFYDRLGIEFRFLPFYLSSSEQQMIDHAITHAEMVDAFKAVFDEWLISEHAVAVEPIDNFIDYALSFAEGRCDQRYDKSTHELIFVVDLDGGTWGPDEIYGNEYKYGNLAGESFRSVLQSEGRRRALARARLRQEQHCGRCQFFGACPGFFVADASPQQQFMIEQDGCPVKPVLEHIVQSLAHPKLRDSVSHPPPVKLRNPALAPNM